jgi:hypothetical protein
MARLAAFGPPQLPKLFPSAGFSSLSPSPPDDVQPAGSSKGDGTAVNKVSIVGSANGGRVVVDVVVDDSVSSAAMLAVESEPSLPEEHPDKANVSPAREIAINFIQCF